MEMRAEILLVILGSALVTFLPRVLPLMVLSRFNLPEWGMRWLNYVPISIMAALVAQELLVDDGKFRGLTSNVELLAAVPTFLIAIWKRSLLLTVVGGIIFTVICRLIV